MSDMHTPGPWVIQFSDIDGRAIRIASPGHYVIAEFIRPANDRVRDQLIADAYLFAAAPELLDEVESLYAELADFHNEWPGRSTSAGQAKLVRLRDLISKATGRDSQEVQDDFTNRSIIAKARGAA
ncbi:hypothetical protein [Pandoraea sputorum]|uniref:Uncharacterized protein n=1 Tax=Pandoraea sputorum TaxID=93222 RepID=A0A5E5BLE0_9BURK|nr:hypothetical protein [Pandoraea sputorum]VVE85160.1 hypothetical protein PSP31121_05109 [Pandoraea sputorum]